LRRGRIDLLESLQRLVDREQVERRFRRLDLLFRDRPALPAAGAAQRELPPRLIDEDGAHGLGRAAKKWPRLFQRRAWSPSTRRR
jgi:hypothetical protein